MGKCALPQQNAGVFHGLWSKLNVSHETNVGRFKAFYGSEPIVYALIYEDLQFTDNPILSIVLRRQQIGSLPLS